MLHDNSPVFCSAIQAITIISTGELGIVPPSVAPPSSTTIAQCLVWYVSGGKSGGPISRRRLFPSVGVRP